MSDPFRREYRPLTEGEVELMHSIKNKAQELYDLIDSTKSTREIALAKTNLEQAVMWAIKSISL